MKGPMAPRSSLLDAAVSAGDIADQAYRKVRIRLIPLLFVCYIAAYLDRVNVGFAKLQMQASLQFSDSVYGLGAGIFFLGYFIFEVPSNVILHRVGARRWIARIMVVWGLLSMATMLVASPTSFYVLRFFLGAAEAGFFPGVILYLSQWFPARRRGNAISLFLCAVSFAGILGGPTSGWILRHLDGVGGWHGWQWMFLLQGLPSVLLGLLVWRWLDDRVAGVHWLTAVEQKIIAADIARDRHGKTEGGLRQVLALPQVWLLAFAYFALVGGLYGVSFWLPSIIRAAGVADLLHIGLLSACPWLCGLVAMVWVAGHADRAHAHAGHCAAAALVGGCGLAFSAAFGEDLVLAMLGLTFATMGVLSALPVFWGLPTGLLAGGAAAAGIALINSFGNLSGFGGPYLLGLLHDLTRSHEAGLYLLAVLVVAGGALAFCVRLPRPPGAPSPAPRPGLAGAPGVATSPAA